METQQQVSVVTPKTVGSSVLRLDSELKVRGRAQYVRDMGLPRMLHSKIKRCPFPHAKILRIDVSKAKEIPGVRAIITGKDFPVLAYSIDTPPLAYDEVLYANQAVAAVAADNLLIAERAVEAIDIEYQQLPAVFDPELAMSKETPTIIKHAGEVTEMPNVAIHTKVRTGNCEKAFHESDYIVENKYTTAMESHFQLEPLTFLAQPDGTGGAILWSTSSGPHKTQLEIARLLDMDPHLIRVKVPFLGGWFGSKEESHLGAVCIILALKSTRPVKLELTREETMTASGVRHPAIIHVKDGVSKSGKIIAREIKSIYNGGAYGDTGNHIMKVAGLRSSMIAYDIANFNFDSYRVYTNRVPGSPKRSPIATQMTWAIECQMDRIAAKLGLDPAEFRLAHTLRNGMKSAVGEVMHDICHDRCIQEVTRAIQWTKRPRKEGTDSAGPWRYGRGIALAAAGSAGGTFQATVRVRENGRVEVWADVVENGGGIYTGIAQLVAEEFGIPVENVTLMPLVYGADSSTSGLSLGASGDRQLVHTGGAVVEACRDAKRKIAKLASKKLDADPNRIEVRGGLAFVGSDTSKKVQLSELFLKTPIFSGTGYYTNSGDELVGFGVVREDPTKLDRETGRLLEEKMSPYYTSVAQVAEVSVNIETGRFKVHRIFAATDVGKAINPDTVKRQIIGCVAMGVNTAMSEEMIVNNGQITNSNLADYKLLTAVDAPIITPIVIENPFTNGPFGAKSVGEPSLLPTAAAIRNAIYDATGAFVNDCPITPERVLEALEKTSAKVGG